MKVALIIFAGIGLLFGGWFFTRQAVPPGQTPMVWASQISPGKVSKFHADIEGNCGECHAPYGGVSRDRCVLCHAAPADLLMKQNTVFHAGITSCTGCHIEHQGREAAITRMDHTHIALVAAEMVADSVHTASSGVAEFVQQAYKGYHGADIAVEKTLNCASCHAYQDPHLTLFGSDCSTCHASSHWTIAAFRHPSPSSRDCSQCHQAPPSHYMMHFEMISETVAGREHMEVSQCYACHQTTAWNDIKGVGWYDHH